MGLRIAKVDDSDHNRLLLHSNGCRRAYILPGAIHMFTVPSGSACMMCGSPTLLAGTVVMTRWNGHVEQDGVIYEMFEYMPPAPVCPGCGQPCYNVLFPCPASPTPGHYFNLADVK